MSIKDDIFYEGSIHMHPAFAQKLILLISQGHLSVIYRHCHADTYSCN